MLKIPHAVLFDLDGTLLDTALDLGNALNHVLNSEGRESLSQEAIRLVASDGSLGLLKLGFGITEQDPKYNELRIRLLDFYNAHIADKTRLFPGMQQVLNTLTEKNIAWGIVTNKPYHLTERLLNKLNIIVPNDCVVGGDTLPQRKPHPAPLLHAAKILHCAPKNCWYVGDAARDIEAGKRADMTTIGALYGYINADVNPVNWYADFYINTPEELLTKL